MFGSVVEVEIDEHAHQAVVGVDGIHVVHVVHAAHLLFDGRGHGLLDGLRVGADVIGLDEDLRRHDLGKLRDGQRPASSPGPTMTMMMEITMATMGRLMKNLDMA